MYKYSRLCYGHQKVGTDRRHRYGKKAFATSNDMDLSTRRNAAVNGTIS